MNKEGKLVREFFLIKGFGKYGYQVMGKYTKLLEMGLLDLNIIIKVR
jgi:hypothetical protein